jgi:hypothetical protein
MTPCMVPVKRMSWSGQRKTGPDRLAWAGKRDAGPEEPANYLQAEIFLVAAAMLSSAAFKVLRDVAMFMRM